MGKKVNPLAMRPDFKYSVWFTTNPKLIGQYINEDYKIRQLGAKVLGKLNYAQIGIERIGMQTNIKIYTHKPGLLVGGRDNRVPLIEEYKKQIKTKILPNTPFVVLIDDYKIKAESSPVIIANNLAKNVEDRMNYKSISKRTLGSFMRIHPDGGIRIVWKGRINGTDIARVEKFQDGKMPTSSIKENVEFAYAVAHTTVGTVTVRVYTYTPQYELMREERRKMEGAEGRESREPRYPNTGNRPFTKGNPKKVYSSQKNFNVEMGKTEEEDKTKREFNASAHSEIKNIEGEDK